MVANVYPGLRHPEDHMEHHGTSIRAMADSANQISHHLTEIERLIVITTETVIDRADHHLGNLRPQIMGASLCSKIRTTDASTPFSRLSMTFLWARHHLFHL